MPAKLEAKDAPVAGPITRRPLGRKVPNLVQVIDNEKDYVEFRVQCEVLLEDKVQAARVRDDLAQKTPEALGRAKKVVLDWVDRARPKPTARFRKIVEDAFDDNIDELAKPKG